MMKHSIQAISEGAAAYAAEVRRLQVAPAGDPRDGSDPLLRAVPDEPTEPSEVEMLLDGLREIEIEREGE